MLNVSYPPPNSRVNQTFDATGTVKPGSTNTVFGTIDTKSTSTLPQANGDWTLNFVGVTPGLHNLEVTHATITVVVRNVLVLEDQQQGLARIAGGPVQAPLVKSFSLADEPGDNAEVLTTFAMQGKAGPGDPIYGNIGGVYASVKAKADGTWRLPFVNVPVGTWDLTVHSGDSTLIVRRVRVVAP